MIRFARFLFAMVCVLILATHAQAREAYLSGKVGFNVSGDTHFGVARGSPDVGLSLLGAIGVEMDQPFRLEAELGYLTYGYDGVNPANSAFIDGDIGSFNFMGNALVDLNRGGRWNPYVGAGLGLALVTANLDTLGVTADDADVEPAFQGILGLEYATRNPRYKIMAEYRYFIATDPNLNFGRVGRGTELESHLFLVGVRAYWDNP